MTDDPRHSAPAIRPLAKGQRVDAEAWRLHRLHGHPEGYDGPCWGPTLTEIAEAKESLR